jgi:hypothetical protein
VNSQGRAACHQPGVMMLFFGPGDESELAQEIRERQAKPVCGNPARTA